MDDCVFCKIIHQDIPADIIYEDSTTLAFLDINPVNPGHTLVIPKEHHVDMHNTPGKILKDVISTSQKISTAVQKATHADGINIVVNTGRGAGQVVFHTHFHVIPRQEGDGFELWRGVPYENTTARTQMKENIKNVL